jgi:hypothetical protein
MEKAMTLVMVVEIAGGGCRCCSSLLLEEVRCLCHVYVITEAAEGFLHEGVLLANADSELTGMIRHYLGSEENRGRHMLLLLLLLLFIH